jgi:hypothetical protein
MINMQEAAGSISPAFADNRHGNFKGPKNASKFPPNVIFQVSSPAQICQQKRSFSVRERLGFH